MMKIPYGYCQCGCNQSVSIVKMTAKKWGHIAGQPMRFIRGHNMKGQNHPLWKGGNKIGGDGRRWIYMPSHIRANKNYILRYILVAEKILGKPLPKAAVIHHVDENTSNDENVNLVICENDTYHKLLHQRIRALKSCGHVSWRKCWICKKYDDPSNLYIRTYKPQGGCVCHRQCKSERYYMRKAGKL